jgi:thiol-disulfide isomerase/thioredoxin
MKGIRSIAAVPLLALSALAMAAPSVPPEFTHRQASDWLNSDPLTLVSLKGKVVLVEFWAFECDNCIKSRPWVQSLEPDEAAGLVIIGVHSPELRRDGRGR